MIRGYRINNGNIEINTHEAEMIRNIFKNYLAGMSLKESAEKAGLSLTHSTVKSIIRQNKYTGNEYYPAVISMDTFLKANEELNRRAELRTWKPNKCMPAVIHKYFRMKNIEKVYAVPSADAEYLYSLITEADYE